MLSLLRVRGSALSAMLVPVLLFSWLMAFCGTCSALAETAQASTAMNSCHQEKVVEHDCCDQDTPCVGMACSTASFHTLPSGIDGERLLLMVKLELEAVPAWSFPSTVPDACHIPIPPLSEISVPDPTPHYLRNCSFLI